MGLSLWAYGFLCMGYVGGQHQGHVEIFACPKPAGYKWQAFPPPEMCVCSNITALSMPGATSYVKGGLGI